MSSNNNDNAGIAMLFGLAGAALMVFWIAIFAFFSFLAFVFTILSFVAWNKPLRIGPWTITPEEARSFVKRGFVGAYVLPAFCLFLQVFLGVPIEWGYLPLIMIAGYSLGSVGIEMMIQHDLEERRKSAPPTMPAQQVLPPARQDQPRPFGFASWDDEEESGR